MSGRESFCEPERTTGALRAGRKVSRGADGRPSQPAEISHHNAAALRWA